MSGLREQQLAEHLKDLLIGVQKSQQINEKLSKWEKKALQLNEKEIEKAAKRIAGNVERYVVENEKSGNPFDPSDVKKKLAEELEKFSK